MKKKNKNIGAKLKEFSAKTRLRSTDKFKERVLKLFGKYIKSIIIMGSITRGQQMGKSDVDIYIIFDDTKFPLKKFDDIRDRVYKDFIKIARSIDPRLHPQPAVALTEFWDGIRKCNPLFYCIVREGYAIYDTGFFIPMRKLLEWGKFPMTKEAADIRMQSVPARLRRVHKVKAYMVAEDIFQAMLDATQATLMYMGVPPPVPRLAAEDLRKHLVSKKLLEEKYAQMMEDVVLFHKAVEYKDVKTLTGKEVDEWVEKAEDFVKRMDKLIKSLENARKASDIKKSYDVMLKATVAALKSINKLPKDPKKLPTAFNKYLISTNLTNPIYSEVLENVVRFRKRLADKNISDIPEREVYLNKEYVRRFVFEMKDIIEHPPKNIDVLLKENDKMQKAAKKEMIKAKKELETAKQVKKLPKMEDTCPMKKKTTKKKVKK